LSFVLDSNMVIYEVDGRLATPLGSGTFKVSVISKIELLSYPQMTSAQESAIAAVLNTVDVVELDSQIVDEAIRLRKSHRLRLPDAVIAATAIVEGAELLTHDANLLKVPGLKASAPPLK
jgi:predicted nucleic acid-binding protein